MIRNLPNASLFWMGVLGHVAASLQQGPSLGCQDVVKTVACPPWSVCVCVCVEFVFFFKTIQEVVRSTSCTNQYNRIYFTMFLNIRRCHFSRVYFFEFLLQNSWGHGENEMPHWNTHWLNHPSYILYHRIISLYLNTSGPCKTNLGGGFKYFLFSPLLGEIIQFD